MNALRLAAFALALVSPSATPAIARGDDLPAPVARERTDDALSAARLELLKTAFAAASAFPEVPHARDRARAQAAVVAAALELGQWSRARQWAERIDGWQRGNARADVALQLARRGGSDEAVAELLELALEDARLAAQQNAQEWSVDRIRARVAAAHLRLGQPERAAEAARGGLVDSEQGLLEAERAALGDPGAAEAHLVEIDTLFELAGFDRLRNGLDAGVRHYQRVYPDEELRVRLEEKIRSGSRKLPPMIRIQLLGDLAEAALGHGDGATALRLAGDALELLEGARWGAEHFLPMSARLATLRFRGGDRAGGRAQAEAALELFARERDRIVDIDRAGALIPVGEAFHAMGLPELARGLYLRALDEATVNPNSRPRANDLVAACLSLAVRGPEADETLRQRVAAVAGSLAAPW